MRLGARAASVALTSGVPAGDVIVGVNGVDLRTELEEVLKAEFVLDGEPVRLRVRRSDMVDLGTLDAPAEEASAPRAPEARKPLSESKWKEAPDPRRRDPYSRRPLSEEMYANRSAGGFATGVAAG